MTDTTPLAALQQSVERLYALVEPMTDAQLESQAYPKEWRVADVLSHLGSGAVIMEERLASGVRGEPMADDFAPAVWDEWNAKSPRAKADDALVADRAAFDRLAATPEADRAKFQFAMGPMEFDFPAFVQLRLNEHTLHAWDVEVAGDPSAALAPTGTALVIDNLSLIARFTGKALATGRALCVRTTDPSRAFTVTTGPDAVALEASEPTGAPDLTLPAEAFIRLIYGRLDAEHTPAVEGDAVLLDELRGVFPGP